MASSPRALTSGITWHPAWTTWGGSPVLLTDTFEYILIYVDDILCVHHDPGKSLAQIDKYFKMKSCSIMEPTFYLVSKLKKTVMPNGVVDWGRSSSKYAQAAVQNVQ
jgi:hypothetical protein